MLFDSILQGMSIFACICLFYTARFLALLLVNRARFCFPSSGCRWVAFSVEFDSFWSWCWAGSLRWFAFCFPFTPLMMHFSWISRDWRFSHVSPVFKNVNMSDAGNYRPCLFNITFTASKIFEKLIFSRFFISLYQLSFVLWAVCFLILPRMVSAASSLSWF